MRDVYLRVFFVTGIGEAVFVLFRVVKVLATFSRLLRFAAFKHKAHVIKYLWITKITFKMFQYKYICKKC